ncbi:glycoside hydrolase family 73 protein [Paraburkholderia atlantica]|uniref:glycoside hydrolase family 73 protein n=1 Tax=Paraburkholderia atlantica TaxID=2654982 RepID=UPI00160996A0|nr:glucosaminidase domain-containing protein [Paraburkholderia atlantica]MBB5508174.1 flagellar protein FlgJ [Paraburkholderia atlantica]
MTPKDFIAAVAPAAKTCCSQTSIPVSFTIAQAALESGWGAHAPGNALFGIKATPDWKGATQTQTTCEVVNGKTVTVSAVFRAYPDWLASIQDHAKFLTGNPRYRPAFAYTCGINFAKAVQAAGYATDPDYANKIASIIRAHGLGSLDVA